MFRFILGAAATYLGLKYVLPKLAPKTGAGTANAGTDANKGPNASPDTKWGGTFQLMSTLVGGAEEGDNVPIVVLLQGQASNPAEALAGFPLGRAANVVIPVATYPHGGAGRFSYWDPALTGDARDKAQRDAGASLATAIDAYLADRKPSPPRAVVVGLDASGPLAVLLALTDPLNVRYAWATGGVVPASWVPAKLPLLNNLPAPHVYKLTYGLAVAGDTATAAIANARGWDYQLDVVAQPPAQWSSYVVPTLEPLLLTA